MFYRTLMTVRGCNRVMCRLLAGMPQLL
jgi:hypothetical protein